MKTTTLTLALVGSSLIGLSGLAIADREPTPQQVEAPAPPDMGAMLMRGLQQSEGCLGVEVAQFESGKVAFLAWFKDKQAAVRWYHSPIHQRMVGMAGDDEGNVPLEHVEDGTPVMVMASITMSDRPRIQGLPMPISQIAIELYTPLPGGAAVNGRLAPDAFEVEHMSVYSTSGK